MIAKTLIYLSDLTHTGSVISSNVHPLAGGLIGAQLLRSLPEIVEVEVFKYPQDLSRSLRRRMPRIAGFTNYSWNCDLSYQYASRIKKSFPDTVIVFGGPNYGLTEEEMLAFWNRFPLLDFYVVKEGELAMIELVKALHEVNYDVLALKRDQRLLPNCHYWSNGKMMIGEMLPRIKDLGELSSPYLMGLMDKFFDQVLSPMVHTTRGCPFTCTFCSEGSSYYSKVAQRIDLKDELEYIAQRVGSVPDLYLTDANFGMYKEDKAKAGIIASIQDKYGWPQRVVVSTGKNRKEHVIEVASMLNGALNIAASLQSTDQTVLSNIQRSNISLDALSTMAQQANKTSADTYSEIILGLPGDTMEKHMHSLRDVVEANLGVLRMYQLIMLPQTELNTPKTRNQYAMKTKYRIMPRSFGKYDFQDEIFSSVESEEICIQTHSLSFEEYIECRELDLTVEIVHNGRTFAELWGLCKWAGFPWFDFIMRFHNTRRSFTEGLIHLYDSFRAETISRLWDRREDLAAYVRENMDAFFSSESSTNEMSNGKAVAFLNLQVDLHNALFAIMKTMLKESERLDEIKELYLEELKEYGLLRKVDLTNAERRFNRLLHFDFSAIGEQNYNVDPSLYLLDKPCNFLFAHTDKQKTLIEGYVKQYGTSLDGMSRILMRVSPIKRLFREVVPAAEDIVASLGSFPLG
ncbi:MAG: radical SAM protein [Chlamydiae bacterium]|nr:radical SAM protein [Chlamydiota bacterium]MBI3276252.1 radical SAM protein [Chlamydiota bacterium]